MADWPYNSARWRRLREAKLADDPLCEDCSAVGLTVPANTADHRRAISDGGDPFPPLGDLSSKCAPCHSRKTARGPEAGAVKTDRPIQPRRGCMPDGSPIDKTHPWAT